jgi:hypothetical protein
MNEVAATVPAMRVNNPTPAIACEGTAITTRPTGSMELVSDHFLNISLAA